MTVLEKLGESLAKTSYDTTNPAERDAMDNHILDTVCATLAGSGTPDGLNILLSQAVNSNGYSITKLDSGPLGRVARLSAVTRLSEIDDIHLRSGTTPGSVIVPTALALSGYVGNTDADLFRSAVIAGYETITRFGAAVGGASLIYQGIWTTHLAAPFGTAAVTARILQMPPSETAHALAISLSMMSGRIGKTVHDKAARWLMAGHSARAGCYAALMAAEGYKGDIELLDGNWFQEAQGIPINPGLLTVENGRLAALETSIKPYCSAKQAIAPVAAFQELILKGVSPAEISSVRVHVPEPYLGMIDHGIVPGNRSSSITSAPYQMALAAYNPAGLYDVSREKGKITSELSTLMDKITVVSDTELIRHFPHTWPARVEIDIGGRTVSSTVTSAPGDPENPFDRKQITEKFHKILDPLLGDVAVTSWTDICTDAATGPPEFSDFQNRYLTIAND